MTAKLLTAMRSLTETENKNINIHTNETKKEQIKTAKKKTKQNKTEKHTQTNKIQLYNHDISPGCSTN